MHLPCARSHSNAAAVLVDRFFSQCLVARREERRGRGREDIREKRERERRKEREQERERREVREKSKTTQKHKHTPPTQHPHNTQHHHDQTPTPSPPPNTSTNTNTTHYTHQTQHSTADNRPWSWDEKVNAWICAPRSTDRDPANAIFIYNCNNCNVCNVCNFDADLLFSIYDKPVMSVIWYSPIVIDFIPH